MVLLALVDADYKFIWIDTGGEGHQSDGQLFGVSELIRCIEDNTITFLTAILCPTMTETHPSSSWEMMLFPLRTFLMKPYGRSGLDNEMMVANYRISRGRRVVEYGFRTLANKFRCFMGTMEQGPGVVRLLVETGVLLHNLLRIRFPTIGNAEVDREDEDHNIIPGAWRVEQQVQEIPQPKHPTEVIVWAK